MSDEYNKIYSALVKQAFGLKDDNKEVNELKNEISQIEANTATIIKRLVDYIEEQGNKINNWKKQFSQDYKKDMEKLFGKKNNIKQGFTREQIGRIIDERLKEIKVISEDIYSSRSLLKENETIDEILRFINITGTGTVYQILIESPSNDFEVYIMIDDSIIFDKPYSWFSDYTEELQNISAYLRDGKYYLSIRNLPFQEKLNVNIKVNTSIIFDQLLIRYIVRNEQRI